MSDPVGQPIVGTIHWSTTAPVPPPTPPIDAPAVPKVRQTVDLTQEQHRAFAAWRFNAAVALGRTRMTTQDALQAAVQLIIDDATVTDRLRTKLEEAGR